MKNIQLEKKGAVTIIRLNRPAKLNAFDIVMMDELAAAFEEIKLSQGTHVVLLTGAGKAFCSGIDLDTLNPKHSRLGFDDLPPIIEKWQATLNSLAALPQITIAVINGVCFGGGVEMVLACDFRLASSKALFSLPEVKLGIIPDLGAIPRLVRLVGIAHAKEIILRARNFSALEALRLGLVNRVSEPGDVNGQAQKWAGEFIRMPISALAQAKRLINLAADQTLADSLRWGTDTQIKLLKSPEFRQAIANIKSAGES